MYTGRAGLWLPLPKTLVFQYLNCTGSQGPFIVHPQYNPPWGAVNIWMVLLNTSVLQPHRVFFAVAPGIGSLKWNEASGKNHPLSSVHAAANTVSFS